MYVPRSRQHPTLRIQGKLLSTLQGDPKSPYLIKAAERLSSKKRGGANNFCLLNLSAFTALQRDTVLNLTRRQGIPEI